MKIKLSKLQYETMQFLRTKLDEGSKMNFSLREENAL